MSITTAGRDEERTRIEAEFNAEQASTGLATQLTDVPITYDRIALEWWTAVLCADVPGAQVTRATTVDPDGSNRGHMRVLFDYNAIGEAAGLPPSVFCKDSQGLAVRLFNAQCDAARLEIFYYNEIKPTLGLEGPEKLFAAYNPDTHNSLLVMRDLELESARFCIPESPIDRQSAEKQMDMLARLHAPFYHKTSDHPGIAGLRTFEENTHGYEVAIGMAETTEKGFVASEQVVPHKLWLRAKEIWPATLEAIDIHKQNPVTFTHNDAHLKNWYVDGNGNMCLSDWQAIARGHWSHDVTFAISTSLEVENRRAWDRDLLACYRDRLHAHGGPLLDMNEMIRAFRKNLLISLCWWTPCVKHDQGFSYHAQDHIFEVIKRTSTAIDDWDSLSAT